MNMQLKKLIKAIKRRMLLAKGSPLAPMAVLGEVNWSPPVPSLSLPPNEK